MDRHGLRMMGGCKEEERELDGLMWISPKILKFSFFIVFQMKIMMTSWRKTDDGGTKDDDRGRVYAKITKDVSCLKENNQEGIVFDGKHAKKNRVFSKPCLVCIKKNTQEGKLESCCRENIRTGIIIIKARLSGLIITTYSFDHGYKTTMMCWQSDAWCMILQWLREKRRSSAVLLSFASYSKEGMTLAIASLVCRASSISRTVLRFSSKPKLPVRTNVIVFPWCRHQWRDWRSVHFHQLTIHGISIRTSLWLHEICLPNQPTIFVVSSWKK